MFNLEIATVDIPWYTAEDKQDIYKPGRSIIREH
jgi:hypothetical protein